MESQKRDRRLAVDLDDPDVRIAGSGTTHLLCRAQGIDIGVFVARVMKHKTPALIAPLLQQAAAIARQVMHPDQNHAAIGIATMPHISRHGSEIATAEKGGDP